MKKTLCFITSIIISASILAGCSSNKTAGNQNSTGQSSTQDRGGRFGNGGNQNNGMPRLSGEVASIDGNKITLKVIQNSNRGLGNRGVQPGSQNAQQGTTGNGQNNIPGSQGEGQVPPTDAQSAASAQVDGQNSNGTPQGGQANGQPNGQRQNRQPGSGPNMQVQYTGETKTIAIPDGISITTFSRNSQGGGTDNITITDIKVGDRLTVIYSDTNESSISGITVMRLNQNQKQNTSQNQNQNSL